MAGNGHSFGVGTDRCSDGRHIITEWFTHSGSDRGYIITQCFTQCFTDRSDRIPEHVRSDSAFRITDGRSLGSNVSTEHVRPNVSDFGTDSGTDSSSYFGVSML